MQMVAFRAASGSGGGSGPSITSLNPASGPVGTAVTIAGTNFGTTQGTSTVTFNGTAATPTSWSATSIVVPVPSGATSGNVVVTVAGVASNGVLFTVSPAASLIITTTSLPAGTQNTAYSVTLAASGGQTPYTWSISAGTLPAGLTLTASTGLISGTPTGTGASNFTVQVTDAASLTATMALSVTIGPAHFVDLTWTASTSIVAGYNIYRSASSGGPYVKQNSTLAVGTTYTDSSVLSGQTYYYVATAVDASNNESGYSNEASATVPTP